MVPLYDTGFKQATFPRSSAMSLLLMTIPRNLLKSMQWNIHMPYSQYFVALTNSFCSNLVIWVEHYHWKKFTPNPVPKILLILYFEDVINYLIVQQKSKSSKWITKHFHPLDDSKSLDMAFQEPETWEACLKKDQFIYVYCEL